jgi:hypothetical protein
METIRYYWDILTFVIAFIGFLGLITVTGFMIGVLLRGLWEHGHICTHFMM